MIVVVSALAVVLLGVVAFGIYVAMDLSEGIGVAVDDVQQAVEPPQ